MKIKNFLVLLSFGVMTLASCNNSGNKDAEKEANDANKTINTIDNDDSKFMTETYSGGMMEILAGNIAVQKGLSQSVKDFGQQMITDHGAANNDLKALATQKSVVLPDTISNEDKKLIDALNKEDAGKFDKTYMDMMVEGHKKAIDAFQTVIDHPKDADVKAWAEKTLPTLKHHLEIAKLGKEDADKQYKGRN